MLMKISSYNLL